jgi:hypothetical protein
LPTSGGGAPAFTTVDACRDWVEVLPIANVATAQAQLRTQMLLLPAADLKPVVLFDMLEVLRPTLLAVQEQVARKFCFRPLPLAELEATACNATMELWKANVLAWVVCLQSLLDGVRDLRGQSATVCQRALDAQARLLTDALNAGLMSSADEWRMLHKLYRATEQLGVAAEKVTDREQRDAASTRPMAAYARAVLFSLGFPGDWGARQATAVMRWVERWSVRVTVTASAPAKPVKPPVLVDLDSGRGGFRPFADGMPVEGGEVRHMDITSMVLSMRKRINMLRKGEPPASLALGEEAESLPNLEATLLALYRHWGDGRAHREHARRPSSARAFVAVGVAATHFHVSGKPFRQPDATDMTSTGRIREIATFGRAQREAGETTQTFVLEEWLIQDESVAGLRLLRAAGIAGARLGAGHLLAMRPTDARAFMLGAVRWAQMLASGDLTIGVRVLPGVPQAVAVRPADPGAAAEKFQPGLMLPAVPALHVATCVVLPSGWFRPGRTIEVHGERTFALVLESLLDRGADFDRCAYRLD